MLIQHVLTEEIFSKVFGEDDFHQHNNVAKELYALEETFFTGDPKKRTLRGLGSYSAAIRAAAAQISNHHEKQAFLKVIYENFYKVYNVKAADRLGVVYAIDKTKSFDDKTKMKIATASDRPAALGNETRPAIFRLLMQSGSEVSKTLFCRCR